jgi:hypothetical protein
LGSAASYYRSGIAGLTGGPWLGPASVSMAAAAAPYVAWMTTTAAPAEQTGTQATAAAAAYEAAFAMTVPPPVIAGQPQPADVADRHQHPRAKHAGDRGHRSPLRGDVGPRRRRDVWLRRRFGESCDTDPVQPATAHYQPGRARKAPRSPKPPAPPPAPTPRRSCPR